MYNVYKHINGNSVFSDWSSKTERFFVLLLFLFTTLKKSLFSRSFVCAKIDRALSELMQHYILHRLQMTSEVSTFSQFLKKKKNTVESMILCCIIRSTRTITLRIRYAQYGKSNSRSNQKICQFISEYCRIYLNHKSSWSINGAMRIWKPHNCAKYSCRKSTFLHQSECKCGCGVTNGNKYARTNTKITTTNKKIKSWNGQTRYWDR